MTQELKVGDIVKSFDFNGVQDCFMVGKVIKVSEATGTFTAELLYQVFEGEMLTRKDITLFSARLQGEHFMDRPDRPRVVVLDGVQ